MKKTIAALLLLGCAVVGWRVMRDAPDAEQTLTKHIWIDRFPDGPRDQVQFFLAVKERRQTIGLFQQSSVFKLARELFYWKPRAAGALTVEYPQTGQREDVTYRVTTCKEGDFTLCLELQGNSRGVKKYRSNEDLELDADTDAETAIARARAHLQAR